MNYIRHQPLDLLSYIDEDISGSEKINIQSIIDKELLTIKVKKYHPKLESILEEPFHYNNQTTHNNTNTNTNTNTNANAAINSTILNDIKRLESKYHDKIYNGDTNFDNIDIPLESGIDLNRYQVFFDESSGNVDFTKLYTSLAYSINRLDALKVSLSFINHEKKFWDSNNNYNQYLINNNLNHQISKKRKSIDSINSERKRIQLEKKPVFDYLQNKFNDDINHKINNICIKNNYINPNKKLTNNA
ncbi:uncharacterized protein ASCRUDRAFT_9435 [Ascoidea rubescens DSM 1968]|uniref:Uncharacterized protein n=1 Tax=Ascoidea rubescens DSM 1968 TaxID=1344418 RepID=A0A1D2VCZ1_9ASCO|nr:hypothetical protein ASCRUDRAFT_9435 [Ascoidea rubescens DSM 1968]ODV59373.1 hypothetical protein ASCRUDRAFT_9435 [Ascoidea rubescens DSM 1968]